MASLGLLSAGVAHEIRNPLTIILHGVELLGESIPAGSGEHEIIVGIKKAVLRAEGIIIGLLSSSPHRSSCREWDIVPLAQEVIAELEQNGKLKNIRVETEFPAEPLECSIDRSPFGQALLNIMNNAVEAMPDGGELKVACRATGSGKVAIVIMDDGESIPESELRKVFDPFYTTKQNSGNMGLGLSIAKGIVDAHGGSLAIRSTPGRGTAVTIIIPCSKMGESQKISKDHRHKSGGSA
jgi:two-component system, NtrC family, sensor kinase